MATKRRYKRRTYRKKKRTQKRRVRGGTILDSVKSALGYKPLPVVNKPQPVEDLVEKQCTDSKNDYKNNNCSPTSDSEVCKEIKLKMVACD